MPEVVHAERSLEAVPSDRKEIVRCGYDAVSERYRADDDDPPEYEEWLRALTARLPAQADVLDLGCGCGVPMTRRLTQLGHQVLGVDVSSVQIDRARQLVPSARFLQADASDLLFDPASFDAIVCLYVLIHLPEQEQRALVESFRAWLRPGACWSRLWVPELGLVRKPIGSVGERACGGATRARTPIESGWGLPG